MAKNCSLPSTNVIQVYKTSVIPLTLHHQMQQLFLGGKYLHVKHCYQKQHKILVGEIPTYAIHIYMHNIFW